MKTKRLSERDFELSLAFAGPLPATTAYRRQLNAALIADARRAVVDGVPVKKIVAERSEGKCYREHLTTFCTQLHSELFAKVG